MTKTPRARPRRLIGGLKGVQRPRPPVIRRDLTVFRLRGDAKVAARAPQVANAFPRAPQTQVIRARIRIELAVRKMHVARGRAAQ